MSFILPERPIVLLPKLATAIGLNQALMLQQIHWLCAETQFGKEHKERRWIFNTPEGWQKWFPFWSQSTIRRTLEELRQNGLILAEQLEGNMRPMFYRISDSAPVLLKEGKMPEIDVNACDSTLGKNDKPLAQNEQTGTLKLSKPYIDKENNKYSPIIPSGDGEEFKLEGTESNTPSEPHIEKDPILLRLFALYNRKPTTLLTEKARKVWRRLKPQIDEDDLRKVEIYYRYARRNPSPKHWTYQTLDTFLNNWTGAVDMANTFKEPTCL